MFIGTNLVPRETLTALVGTYKKAVEDITIAYNLLATTKENLKAVFVNDYFSMCKKGVYYNFDDSTLQATLEEVKRQAWRTIVDRLSLRKILSIKRREELDRQLAGERRYHDDPTHDLPDITEENIIAMFQDASAKACDYASEAVLEVFDWLRPWNGDYKTNDKWKVGPKVVIAYACEMGWQRGKFRVNYSRQANMTALDNVFHMLDGKGVLKTHNGPLCDAITDSLDGTGETTYFKFKCFKNHNVHIVFKRPDLVAKMNKIAGGSKNWLKDAA